MIPRNPAGESARLIYFQDLLRAIVERVLYAAILVHTVNDQLPGAKTVETSIPAIRSTAPTAASRGARRVLRLAFYWDKDPFAMSTGSDQVIIVLLQ